MIELPIACCRECGCLVLVLKLPDGYALSDPSFRARRSIRSSIGATTFAAWGLVWGLGYQMPHECPPGECPPSRWELDETPNYRRSVN